MLDQHSGRHTGHDYASSPATDMPRHGWGGMVCAALFYTLLAAFAFFCLLWSLPAGLLALVLPARWGRPLGQWAISAGFRFYVCLLRGTGLLRCDLSALDTLREERGIVIVANHPTLLDAVLLVSRLPRAVCIAKASIARNILLGGGMRLAGYVRNDAPLPMIREAAAAVRGGRQLLIFPEGTRTPLRGPDARLGRFTRSFAVMAQQSGAPVQTVLIDCETEYLRKGVALFRRPRLPLRYRVSLGRRFTPQGDSEALRREVEAYFNAHLAQAD